MTKSNYDAALFAVDLHLGYRLDRAWRTAMHVAPETFRGWFKRVLWSEHNVIRRQPLAAIIAARLADGTTRHLFEPVDFPMIVSAAMGPALAETPLIRVIDDVMSSSRLAGGLMQAFALRRYWQCPIRASLQFRDQRRLQLGGCPKLPLVRYDAYARQVIRSLSILRAQIMADLRAAMTYGGNDQFWDNIGERNLLVAGLPPHGLAMICASEVGQTVTRIFGERFAEEEIRRIYGSPP